MAPSAAHAVAEGSAETSSKQGLRNRLRRAAGAATSSGGSAARVVASVEAIFKWEIRVYWEDTDAGGIVFYANYLKFFERSRTEWLRTLGIEQQSLKDSTGCIFVVTETTLRYHRPARLDDELIVTTRMIETGRASMLLQQQALLKTEHAGVSQATLLCEGTVRIGWVDSAGLRPRRIPSFILDRLKNG